MLLPKPSLPSVEPGRSIGERIKQVRKMRGVSQVALADRLGVSQPTIANWETGVHDPRRVMLARVAEVLEAPLDWLAAGDRSQAETDKQAAAAYLRRPMQHVPVLSAQSAIALAHDAAADLHSLAEDYIPISGSGMRNFAIFISEPAMSLAFPPDTLVIIDSSDRNPRDGDFCLALKGDDLIFRRWRASPDRFEPYSFHEGFEPIFMSPEIVIIGCAKVSVRVH